jgi:hypothetical protein
MSPPSTSVEKERPEKSEGLVKSAKPDPEKSPRLAPLEERFKVCDTDQPIDITSDRVETDTKDSLITFGNGSDKGILSADLSKRSSVKTRPE